MTHLILHAGTHKTGTSAIQAFAALNRRPLLRHGFLYPSLGRHYRYQSNDHNQFAHAITAETIDDHKREKRLSRKWFAEAEKQNLTVIISAESIWRHETGPTTERRWADRRFAYLKKVASLLEPFDVTPVIVLRSQENLVRSLYLEYIKQKHMGMEDDIHFINMWGNSAEVLSFADFRELARKHFLRYKENLDLFREVFPATRVFLYEELTSGGKLASNFFDLLGINTIGMEEVGVVNPSPDPHSFLIKHFFTPAIFSRRERNELRSWIGSPPVQQLVKETTPELKNMDLWEDQGAKKVFAESFAAENEAIRVKFFLNRNTLFPPLGADTGQVPTLSSKAKEALAYTAVASGLLPRSRIEYLSVDPEELHGKLDQALPGLIIHRRRAGHILARLWRKKAHRIGRG